MNRKNIFIIFSIIMLITFVGVTVVLVEGSKIYWSQKRIVKEYGINLSYPGAYEDIPKKDGNIEKISQNLTITENIKFVEDYTPAVFEELIHIKNNRSGITLLVEGLKIEKTEKTIEEICKDYTTMFKVFNPDQTLLESKYEEVIIDGKPAGKVEIFIKGKTEKIQPGIIAYLISLDDREINIVFSGTKEIFKNSNKELEKILNSIEIE